MRYFPAAVLAENSLIHVVGQLFHPVLVVVGTLLAALYAIVPSFGVAIVLLTLIVMGILTPLAVRSFRSSWAMQRLQPEIAKLQLRYKNSEHREQLNQELIALYKEHGVSPAGSCLPSLLQMPFLVVLYDVIRGLTNRVTTTLHGHLVTMAEPRYIPTSSGMYHHLAASHGAMNWLGVNLALEPFSAHAYWFGVVPYLALIVTAVVLRYVLVARTNTHSPQGQPIHWLQRVLPVFFATITFIVPAAVVLYMIVSTAIRIAIQEVLARTGVHGPPSSSAMSHRTSSAMSHRT